MLISDPTCLPDTSFILNTYLKIFKIDSSLLSSPVLQNHKSNQNWDTPTCSKVRLLRKQGDMYSVIAKKTGLQRPTI